MLPLPPVRRPLLPVALLLLASCGGDDGPTGPDPNEVVSVSVSPASATLEVGGTVQLSATATNSQGGTVGATVTWSSSSPGVATVSASGLVTAVSAGSATVTATADGRSGSAAVTVVAPAPPAAPTDLTATPTSHTGVELAWTDASDDEEGFEIERELADGSGGAGTSSFEEVATVGAGVTSFADSELEPATAYRYRVRATNEVGASDFTEAAEATTFAVLVLETGALAGALLDEPYADTLRASGGDGTFAWSLETGPLPPGIELSGEGVLSGTPTASGTFPLGIAVTGGGQTVTGGFELVVSEEDAEPPEIVTDTLPAAFLGVPYSEALEATGGSGSYTWSLVSGTFPDGLSLAADGTVSGTPTTEAEVTVTVAVTSAGLADTAQVGVRVLPRSLEITTTALRDGQVGSGYLDELDSDGGVPPVIWSVVVGTLPAGLELAADGTVTGEPEVAGTDTFTVRAVSEDGQSDEAQVTLTVTPGPVSIVTGNLDGAQVGTPYSLQLQAEGGDGQAYAWTQQGALPPGLSLAADGTLAGTPTTEGTTQFVVRVQSGGDSEIAILILTVIPQPQAGFQIELVYLTSVTPAIREVFEEARERWSELITADETDETQHIPACGSFHPGTQATTDDVVIYVSVDEIDGAGGTLGQAGPCFTRDAPDRKPLTGAMVFDETDLQGLANNGQLAPVILHEMGHVLGIGSLWEFMGLRSGQCLEDPIFTGAGAIQAFDEADGTLYSGDPVPIENGGSLNDGSNCSHWREEVLGNELMSPFLNAGQNPLSAITVESLGDMGYTVDSGAADDYLLPKPVPVGAPALRDGILLVDDLLPIVPRALGPDGRVRLLGGRR